MNLQLNVVRFENEDVIATSCDLKSNGVYVDFTADLSGANEKFISITGLSKGDSVSYNPTTTYYVQKKDSWNKLWLSSSSTKVSRVPWTNAADVDTHDGIYHLVDGEYIRCIECTNNYH